MVSTIAAQEFLAQRRIAVAGVSRDPKQFANLLFRALLDQGYEAIPINPHADFLEGVTAYPNLKALPTPVDGVILMLPPSAVPAAVEDCLAAGVERIWLRSVSGPGATPELAARAGERGAKVLNGGCPFMFLEKSHWFHRCHGAIARWTGDVRA